MIFSLPYWSHTQKGRDRLYAQRTKTKLSCCSCQRASGVRGIARLRNAPYDQVLRAKILLLAWEHPDWANTQIAAKTGASPWTVWKWRKRWRESAVTKNIPRPGAPRFFSLNPKSPNHRSRLHSA
ncbi:MAG: helix-turn-helix domain-containing protein [Elusimicrobia bacterium]|nr:helix-turn-helix domain-containing protein [Elusimicrobiota bacterium]